MLVVTTSRRWPRSVSRRASSRITGIGPPNAVAGQYAGAAARIVSGPSGTAERLALAPVKPRLLVLNQYYWPGVEATANLLTDLCEALADEFDVRVVTGVLHGHEDEPRELERNGVRIERVASTAFERSQLPRRAANYVTYLADSLATALARPAARTSSSA